MCGNSLGMVSLTSLIVADFLASHCYFELVFFFEFSIMMICAGVHDIDVQLLI